MKFHKALIVGIFTLTLLPSASAQANIVDITGSGNGWTMLFNATVGQSGHLYNWYTNLNAGPGSLSAYQEGSIPAHSDIIFSYSALGTPVHAEGSYYDASLYGRALYGNGLYGNTLYNDVTSILTSGNALITVSASGKRAAIANYSNVEAYFMTDFEGTQSTGYLATASYAVNAVPIPRTLYLFATAILGLLVFRRMNRSELTPNQ